MSRENGNWRNDAACRNEDPELFFPNGKNGPAIRQTEEAKAVCKNCTVIDQCLDWSLKNNIDDGVWGGLSEDERRALKRRTLRLASAQQRMAQQALSEAV